MRCQVDFKRMTDEELEGAFAFWHVINRTLPACAPAYSHCSDNLNTSGPEFAAELRISDSPTASLSGFCASCFKASYVTVLRIRTQGLESLPLLQLKQHLAHFLEALCFPGHKQSNNRFMYRKLTR